MSIDLSAVEHLQVRTVMKRADLDAAAIVGLAVSDRQHWTLAEWKEVLSKLDNCTDTVKDWLSLRAFWE